MADTTLDALRTVVAGDPADDLARLTLADWLDEHDGRCGRCQGKAYVEVERWSAGGDDPLYMPIRKEDCPDCAGRGDNGYSTEARDLRLGVWLRRILAAPADDGPRLEYAQVAESYGWVERAEFIRCQLHIAELEALVQRWIHTPHDQPGGTVEDGGPAGAAVAELATLRRRERELLAPNWRQWMVAFLPKTPGSVEIAFRRGFVSKVALPLAAWCGERCEACGGSGQWHGYTQAARPGECDHCFGTGIVGRHAVALLRAASLTRVVLSDREPWEVEGTEVETGEVTKTGRWEWSYLDGYLNRESSRAAIPRALWVLMGGQYSDGSMKHSLSYHTRQAALDALSLAALQWGRLAVEQEDVRAEPCRCRPAPAFAMAALCDRCIRLRDLLLLVEGRVV